MNDPGVARWGDAKFLAKVVKTEMPFGKYKGRKIIDLPDYYMSWYYQKGFPKGELGQLLEATYEIKLNGLEYLLKPLR